MEAPRKHSQKPDWYRQMIERAVAKVFPEPAKIELFAREQIDGWIVWGNEV